jgi:hypothetical protein
MYSNNSISKSKDVKIILEWYNSIKHKIAKNELSNLEKKRLIAFSLKYADKRKIKRIHKRSRRMLEPITENKLF